jgi:sugar lactone lactonase YvrE
MLVDNRYALGESAVWDEREQLALWCNIPAGTIQAARLDGTGYRIWSLPDRVGSFGLCESGRLVVALPKRLVLFDRGTQAMETLAEVETELPFTRLNDGKVGPDGAYWVGTVDERDEKQSVCGLYRVTGDGRVTRKVDGLQTSNGLAWSPDGRTMFHSDSRLQFIDAYDFDPATGAIDNRRRIATPTMEQGRPDGAACDAEGNYWSAGISAGVLNCWSPEGKLLKSVPMPMPNPTMPAFCGPGLKQVFVTSLQRADALTAFAGGVCVGEVGVAGAEVGRLLGA